MKIFLSVSAFLWASCVSMTVVPLAKEAPQLYQGKVAVFTSETQIKDKYAAVCASHLYDWGKHQSLAIKDALPVLTANSQIPIFPRK